MTPDANGGATYTHTTCPQPTYLRVPGEPDRRGQREDEVAPAGHRAELRHPLRRRPDVLRQRAAGTDEPGVRQLEQDVGRQRFRIRTRTLRPDHVTPRRHGRGERAAHGQRAIRSGHRRSRCSATPTSSSRSGVVVPGELRRLRSPASTRASPGTTATSRTRSATPGSAWSGPVIDSNGIDIKTWTDHVDLRPTINALLGLHDNYIDDGRVVTQIVDSKAMPNELRARRTSRRARRRVQADQRAVRSVRDGHAGRVDCGTGSRAMRSSTTRSKRRSPT